MSRRRRAVKREILPDAKFGDVVINRFMNALMYDGKKSAAEGIVYSALDTLKRCGGAQADPIRMFHEALENVKPAIEVREARRSAFALRPKLWTLEGLPHTSPRKGSIAARTAGSSGVVAL